MAEHIYTNHPYTENKIKNKPIHIKGDKIAKFIYPDISLAYGDLNFLYLSTDHMTVVLWEMAPGSQFNPPDYHEGDEIYYILDGEITELNPVTGEVMRAKKGEAMLIPKHSVHIGINFGDKVMRNFAVIAPKSVVDQTFPTDADPRHKLYQGKYNSELKVIKGWEESVYHPTLDDIGEWPKHTDFLRETGFYYHIPEDKKLLSVMGGYENPVLVKTCVSNNYVHVGEYFLPTGGPGPRQTQSIKYEGECFIFAPEERVSVYIPADHQSYVLEHEEGLYLPPNTEHTILNFNANPLKVLFAVAPVD